MDNPRVLTEQSSLLHMNSVFGSKELETQFIVIWCDHCEEVFLDTTSTAPHL